MDNFMGVWDTHVAEENPEYGKRKSLVGDAVAEILELKEITAKKDGKTWLILEGEVISAIADKKGRPTTVTPADKVTLFYDPSEDSGIQKLKNDLLTIGIDVSESYPTYNSWLDAMREKVAKQLMYVRCWMADKMEKDENGDWVSVKGKEGTVQKINVKPRKLITPENSQPMLPF